MNTKQTLLATLLHIKEHGPAHANEGICMAVANVMGNSIHIPCEATEDLLDEAMAAWPKATGSRLFPVPGVGGKSRTASYVDFRDSPKSMWDPETEYGRLRLELLDHCINYLQQEKA